MKILVIRLSSIGDIVLTTPVLRCIKEQIPHAELHFVVKKSFAPVLEANPHIDKIHLFDGNLRALLSNLRRESFDYIADLHKNFRSRLIRLLIRGKGNTYSKLNMQKWLMVNLNAGTMPDTHVAERYFEAVETLGVKNDKKGAEYYIPDAARRVTDTLPWSQSEPYVAIVTGGRYHTKRIPADKLANVCSQLPFPVVLIGGPEDVDQAESIVQLAGRESGLINMCGRTSLNESAALIDNSACIITPDTGMMHIAAALKKKVVSVWGNTVPELGMYAYYGSPDQNTFMSRIIENPKLACRPCSKLGHDACPKKHFACMNSITPTSIVNAVEQLTVKP